MSAVQLNTPVLLLVFKRLETTKQVFAAIRRAQPRRLYIASDGHRPNVPDEAEKIANVRRYLVDHVDWDCEIKTLFRDRNLGCRRAISGAIDWFFEQESEGIILEDDCVPDNSFFLYAEELLARYRKDTRVMAISGDYLSRHPYESLDSYFFSRYNLCWGWATWKRAWRHYDSYEGSWSKLRNTDWLLTVGDGSYHFKSYWTKIFDELFFENKPDSWAYRWQYTCWFQNGLIILPTRNLVRNIGFGEEATHTSNDRSPFSNLPINEQPFPLSHPSGVIRDYRADKWIHENLCEMSLRKRVVLKLKSALKRK